jgi:hypothetical protein
VDEPADEIVLENPGALSRVRAFKTVEVNLRSGTQEDAYSCGFWIAKMILELMVTRQTPSTLDFSLDPE